MKIRVRPCDDLDITAKTKGGLGDPLGGFDGLFGRNPLKIIADTTMADTANAQTFEKAKGLD
jgi:hypothetical protein